MKCELAHKCYPSKVKKNIWCSVLQYWDFRDLFGLYIEGESLTLRIHRMMGRLKLLPLGKIN